MITWTICFCRIPKPIDPEILRTMKVYHNVGYAPNPGTLRRNQIPYIMKSEGTAKGKSNIPESPLGRGNKSTFCVLESPFYSQPHDNGGILWFQIGHLLVHPSLSVVRPSIFSFQDDNE